MHLMERATSILLRPRQAWQNIDAEPADTVKLFTGYLMILAAIPAVCGFIGLSLVGMGAFGYTLRVPVGAGLANALVSYVLSLVGVFVLSLVINALAPVFGGTKHAGQALKVAVYASTAAMLGGVFGLLPSLAVLGLVAALYSVYLLYLGLPLLMRTSGQRAVPYTAAVVVAAIVLGVVFSALLSLLLPRGAGMWGGAGGAPAVAVDTPSGRVTLDTAAMQEAGKKMEEAVRRMEQARQSGDTTKAAEAAQQAVAAAAGAAGTRQQALGMAALRAALPERLGGLQRTSFEAHDGSAMGLPTSQASAEYGSGERTARVTVVDAGGFGQLAQLAGLVQGESESDGVVEKTWQEQGRTLQQSYAKDGSQAEMRAILKNGVVVSIEAEQTGIRDVQALMGQIDLAALEALQRQDKK